MSPLVKAARDNAQRNLINPMRENEKTSKIDDGE